jgi:hypothetical protein
LGKEYWLITKKESAKENPETAPYFLTLNIPACPIPPATTPEIIPAANPCPRNGTGSQRDTLYIRDSSSRRLFVE